MAETYTEALPTSNGQTTTGVRVSNGDGTSEIVLPEGYKVAQNGKDVGRMRVHVMADEGSGATIGTTTDAYIAPEATGTLSSRLRGIHTELGDTNDAASSAAGGSGTLMAYIRGVRDILVDGTNYVLGTRADAAVSTDTDGTINGHTRGLIVLIRSIIDAQGTTATAANTDGTAATFMGHVRGLNAKTHTMSTAIGALGDAVVIGNVSGSLMGHIRGLSRHFELNMPSGLDRHAAVGSLPVVLSTEDKTSLDTVWERVTLLSPATTVTHYNKTLTSANTEYSQALPANCKVLTFRSRNSADVRYAFVTGKVAGLVEPYFTLVGGNTYDRPRVTIASGTLYLASLTAGTVVEIEAWS